MSTAEIIAELPRLAPADLALVQAKLRELAQRPDHGSSARIHGPRLLHSEESKDFVKQVVEIASDAKL